MTPVSTETLARQGFLRGIPLEHVARLAKVTTRVEMPRGHRIFDEGGTADRFWLVQSGLVALDLLVPGKGHLTVETLGIGDVLGWSWFFPSYQWRFGAVAQQPVRAFELDGRAVRSMCAEDSAMGYELTQRFLAVVLNRLQATRVRLMDMYVQASIGKHEEASS